MSLARRVLYLWQEERFANLELRYVGASPFKHLNTMVTSPVSGGLSWAAIREFRGRVRYGHIFLFLLEYERQNFRPVAISGCVPIGGP